MREILFKAKRKDNSKWIKGYYQKRYDLLSNEEHLIFHVTVHVTSRNRVRVRIRKKIKI